MTWAMVTVCGYGRAKPVIRHFERGVRLGCFSVSGHRRQTTSDDGVKPLEQPAPPSA